MNGVPTQRGGATAAGIPPRAGIDRTDAAPRPATAPWGEIAAGADGAPPGLREALLALDGRERDVIQLHSLRGLCFSDVARALGLGSRDAAVTLFDRAMDRLGELLEAEVAGLG